MGLNVLYDAAEGCRHSQELETSRHSFVNSFCHLWPSAFLYNSIISCFTVYIKLHWSICFCIVAIFSEKLFFYFLLHYIRYDKKLQHIRRETSCIKSMTYQDNIHQPFMQNSVLIWCNSKLKTSFPVFKSLTMKIEANDNLK